MPDAIKSAPRFSAAEQLARAANDGPEDMGVLLAAAEGSASAAVTPDAILDSMQPKERRLDEIPLEEIHPKAGGQTREKFDEDTLQRLAEAGRGEGAREAAEGNGSGRSRGLPIRRLEAFARQIKGESKKKVSATPFRPASSRWRSGCFHRSE